MIPVILLGNYLWGYKGIYVGGVLSTVVLGGVAWRWILATINEGEQRAMHTRVRNAVHAVARRSKL